MPQVLQLAHLVEHHGVADVDVRSRGVEPQLDAQRRACGLGAGQLAQPVGLRDQLFASAAGDGHGLQHTVGDGMRGRYGRDQGLGHGWDESGLSPTDCASAVVILPGRLRRSWAASRAVMQPASGCEF
jgi:hypothetical protein